MNIRQGLIFGFVFATVLRATVDGRRGWRRALMVAAVLVGSEPGAAQSDPDGYYIGAIGGQYPIQMQVQSGFDGGVMRYWGTYFYESIGEPISLTGRDEGEAVVLDEAVDYETTGSFRGFFSGERFEGTWTSAKTQTQWAFSLLRVAVFEKLIENTPEWLVDYRYPRFVDNGALAQFVNLPISSSSEKNYLGQIDYLRSSHQPEGPRRENRRNYSVRFVHDSLISCLITDMDIAGGDHWNMRYESINAGYVNGVPSFLGLEELFIPGSGFVSVLSDAAIEQLRLAGAEYVKYGGISGLEEDMLYRFTISPAGFCLHFDARTVDTRSMEVLLPWIKLESVVDRNGPVAPIWSKKR